MKLVPLHINLGVVRLEPQTQVPLWAMSGEFFSVTRTTDELSVVCDENLIPTNVQHENAWAALKVIGPLEFSLTGVLASLATPLAESGISIFAISTFDTDYILVKRNSLDEAIRVLQSAGHSFLEAE